MFIWQNNIYIPSYIHNLFLSFFCKIIYIIFFDLSRYDGHFLITEVSKAFDGYLQVLPLTKKNYISFTAATENSFRPSRKNKTIIRFKFIDSLRFMASSLDKLASYLTDYPIVKKCFPNLESEKCQLLLRKGVFPYEWLDNFEKLKFTKLPEKKHFFSLLNNAHISEDDYLHAQRVWQEFEIKNFA